MATTEVRRDRFKNFWDKYSDRPDTNTMMLNHSADDLEGADRADILSCLPQLRNKDVVDIGAGIGRFTTVLAESAKSVLSTDFIESFMAKNQERNAHMGNVNYQVGDAVHLKMDPASVDLVFTNWLMMYLSDSETIEFLFNCMRWLRASGFVHLRESCSEPSTGRTKTNTMHTADANPTHYRFSSLYIKLLREMRYQDDEGKIWEFDVQWSCSVPTYIQYQQNWRQVHWLARKVPSSAKSATSPQYLLELLSKGWYEEQIQWDQKLDNEKYVWTDEIFANVISPEDISKDSTVYVYTPRSDSPYLHVNSHLLAEKFFCNVWNVELNPYLYRTSLTKANTVKDKKVRFAWNETLSSSIAYWTQRDGSFDSIVATELLSTTTSEERKSLSDIISSEAKLCLLEPVDELDDKHVTELLTEMGVKKINIQDVTSQCVAAQEKYLKDHNLNDGKLEKKWILIRGTF